MQDGATTGQCVSVGIDVEKVPLNELNVVRAAPSGLPPHQANDPSIRTCFVEGKQLATEKAVSSREEDRTCHFAKPLSILRMN
jgi:hypothetical protein